MDIGEERPRAPPATPPMVPAAPSIPAAPPQPGVGNWGLHLIPEDAAHRPGFGNHYTVAESKPPADFAGPSPEVECYGNFEAMGVIVTPPADLKPAAIAGMHCWLNVASQWKPMQDPVQIGATNHFATSIFWLGPESRHQVKITAELAADKTVRTWYGQGQTRNDGVSEYFMHIYHWVAPDGDDAGDGSPQHPWKTLAHAIKVAGGLGDDIILRPGVYYEGDLALPKIEKANNSELEIGGDYHAPPGSVVIDGSDPKLLDPTAWKSESAGLYSHPFDDGCQNVVLENKKTGVLTRLLPIFTPDELRTRTVGKHGDFAGGTFADQHITGAFATDGKTMWLLPPAPLTNFTVHAAKYTRAFLLDGSSNVRFSNLTIRYFGKNAYACAALIENSSKVTFEKCHFLFVDVGLWVKGKSDDDTVQDCTFLDGVNEFPFALQKTGGNPVSFEAGAVNVDSIFSGRGLVVRNNHIENEFDGVHLCPWVTDDAVTNEIDFYGNTIQGCLDDFIETDGFSRNVRIFDNTMRGSLSGVSLAQALGGPTYVCYNVIADCGQSTSHTREGNGGYPFKTNGGDGSDVGCGPMFFYHNTAASRDPESRAIWVKHARWRNLTLRDNIWIGRAAGFECWEKPPSPIDWDFDDLFCRDTTQPLIVLKYHTQYRTLADIRNGPGWLKHGLSADPQFTDENSGVYTLQPGSPCVDAGTPIPGIDDGRIHGKAPDMGAFEAP